MKLAALGSLQRPALSRCRLMGAVRADSANQWLIPICNQRGLFQHRACGPHLTAQQVSSFQFPVFSFQKKSAAR
jgi:hypothetical protein